jgi:hypothetical protein
MQVVRKIPYVLPSSMSTLSNILISQSILSRVTASQKLAGMLLEARLHQGGTRPGAADISLLTSKVARHRCGFGMVEEGQLCPPLLRRTVAIAQPAMLQGASAPSTRRPAEGAAVPTPP